MLAALKAADASPADVVHLNAHATSTPVGDTAEANSIRAALGSAADGVCVSATKSMTGHLLGAAGAVEGIFTILALHHRLAPPTINVDDLDPEVTLDVVDRQASPARGRRPGRPQQLVRFRRPQRGPGHSERLVTATHPGQDLKVEVDPRDPELRLGIFFDEGSVELLTERDDSGMLAARGTVNGTPAVAFASDATIQGGAMGEAGCKVCLVAYERALADGVPVVGLWHSGGARLREGVVSLHAVGEVFAIMTRASGKIPQISVVIGAAAGGAAYGPALTDIVILGPDGRVFVTGPDVVRSVTGENVDALRLGGPEPHGRRSGVVHVVTETTEQAYERAQLITHLLGSQGSMDLSAVDERPLEDLLPESHKRAYDVHPLVDEPAGLAGDLGRAVPQVGAEHRHDAGPARRPHRRRHREQPDAPRRLPGLLVGGEGGAVRPDVRRVRRPADRRRRRPRLPAGRRAGVGRRRAPRRQAAARLRRGRWSPGSRW